MGQPRENVDDGTVPQSGDDRAPADPADVADDRPLIRALLRQTPDQRLLGLRRAARFFAGARRV